MNFSPGALPVNLSLEIPTLLEYPSTAQQNSTFWERDCKSWFCQPNMCLGKLFQVSLTSNLCLSLQESKLLISGTCLWQLLTISIDMYSPLSTSEKRKTNPSDHTQKWHEQGEQAKKRDHTYLFTHAALKGLPLGASSLSFRSTICCNKTPVQFSAAMSRSN